MKHILLRRILRMLSIWLASALLWLAAASSAQAQVVCNSFSMSNVSFGSFTPFDPPASTQGTLSFQCYNTMQSTRDPAPTYFVSLCFHMGTGTTGGANWDPRVMTTTNSTPSGSLRFQIYNNGLVWGSRWGWSKRPAVSEVLQLPPRTRSGATTVVSGSIGFDARVISGQTTAIPGNYTNQFNGVHTEIIAVASSIDSNPSCLDATASDNVSLSPNTFSFVVSATVRPACIVAATPMNFGAIDAIRTGPFFASSNIGTRCTNSTPYQIALEPRGTPTPTDGSGIMRSSSTVLSNADTFVRYNLYRDAARSQAWGNILDSNTQRGVGTGEYQTPDWTVYGRINSVNVIPDSYSDTVTVKVYY